MSSLSVNGKERRSQVLSVRLRHREFKRLQVTLRNFDIQADNLSEQLRAFFRQEYYRSVRVKRRRRRERHGVESG